MHSQHISQTVRVRLTSLIYVVVLRFHAAFINYDQKLSLKVTTNMNYILTKLTSDWGGLPNLPIHKDVLQYVHVLHNSGRTAFCPNLSLGSFDKKYSVHCCADQNLEQFYGLLSKISLFSSKKIYKKL